MHIHDILSILKMEIIGIIMWLQKHFGYMVSFQLTILDLADPNLVG
jgi:hypothetical protein